MTRTRLIGLGALLCAGLVAAACVPPPPPPPPGPVADRHVAAGGTDEGDCSAATAPCATIGYAVSQADPADVVQVGPGTYPEVVVVDRDLTFRGANAGTPGTAPRTAESVVKGFRNPGNPGTTQFDVTIDGFRIDPQGDAALIAATLQPLVWLRGGAGGVAVVNNLFHGGDHVPSCSFNCTTMTDSAFTVQSGVADFSDNLVQNFRRPVNVNQPVGAPATSATVTGNTFTGVTSRAVSLAGSTGVQMGGQVVSGNSFSGGGHAAPSAPAGITVSNASNTISDNTFTGLSSGVYLDLCKKFVTDDNSITGNTFTGNGAGININVNTDGGQCVSSATEGSGGWVVGGGRIDGLVVSGNEFSGNASYAVRHAAYNWGFWNPAAPAISTGPIDVSCNWWNDPAGPVVVTLAYGDTLVASPDQLVNSAPPHAELVATPWLTSPGGPCDGGL